MQVKLPEFDVVPQRRAVRIVCRYSLPSCSIKNFKNICGFRYSETQENDSRDIVIALLDGMDYKMSEYLYGLACNVCKICRRNTENNNAR